MSARASASRGAPGRRAPRRSWQARLDDPDEPLYTMAITADLLGVDTQTLRRLEDAAALSSTRPSGNQRRYSRNDIAVLSRAAELSREGQSGVGIARIIELERQVDELTPRRR